VKPFINFPAKFEKWIDSMSKKDDNK